MHETFEKEGSKVVMLIVAQKEPHAGTLAYKDISQPETVAERTKLAKRMKDEFELPMTVLVDSMNDTSRALFTDLPSPAFIIDEEGILRAKMSWSQPEDIARFLKSKKDRQPSNESSEESTSESRVSGKQATKDNGERKFDEYSIFKYRAPTNWVTVSIRNRTGMSLVLQRVDFDEVQTVLQLGNEENLQLQLESAYYVLSTVTDKKTDSKLRWAVPADAKLVKNLELTLSAIDVPKNLHEQWSLIPEGPSVVGDVMGLGRDEERPARIEYIDSYLMGRYEVSNQQYADFLNDQEKVPSDWLDLKSRKCLIKRVGSKYIATAPSKPVVMVSRKGARRYCDWLTQKTNVVHRLATEAEWEKAARGPESFLYAYGNICRIAAANQESGHLRECGQFAPNGFGLYDMTGNCFEWVSGDYATSTKLTGLLRGGSFIFDGIYNRTSFRMRQAPTVMTDDIGFRVVRELSEKTTK